MLQYSGLPRKFKNVKKKAQKMYSKSCILHLESKENIMSYFGLIDGRTSVSEKD
jgi:hypothetical protein